MPRGQRTPSAAHAIFLTLFPKRRDRRRASEWKKGTLWLDGPASARMSKASGASVGGLHELSGALPCRFAIINRMICIHYLTGLVQIAYSSGLSAPPAKESRPQLPDAAHARRGAVPLPPSNPPGHARANPGPSQTLAALPIELAVLRRHQSAPRSRPHPAVSPTSRLPPRVGDKQSGCLLRTPSAQGSIHARPHQQSPTGRLSRGTWQRPAAVLARYLSVRVQE
jgi:hypothetical protein